MPAFMRNDDTGRRVHHAPSRCWKRMSAAGLSFPGCREQRRYFRRIALRSLVRAGIDMNFRCVWLAIFSIASLIAGYQLCAAQAYPLKPVRIIIGGAGGANDV